MKASLPARVLQNRTGGQICAGDKGRGEVWNMVIANTFSLRATREVSAGRKSPIGCTEAPLQGSWSQRRQPMLVVRLEPTALKGGDLGALIAETAMARMLALAKTGCTSNVSRLCAYLRGHDWCAQTGRGALLESPLQPLTSNYGKNIKYV